MSVRKRIWKTIEGESRLRWVVDYTDPDGNRRHKTFEKQATAKIFAAKTRTQIEDGSYARDTGETIAEAGEHWLKTLEADMDAGKIERTTYDQYEQHYRLHIAPFLGRTKLSQFSRKAAIKFRNDLGTGDPAITAAEKAEIRKRLNGGGKVTNEELRHLKRSPAMVRGIMASLGGLLAEAVDREAITRNVVRELRQGGRRSKARAKRQKRKLVVGVDIPTPDEVATLLATAKRLVDERAKELDEARARAKDNPSTANDAAVKVAEFRWRTQLKWRVFLLTNAVTGLRGSELRGLPWTDVDLAPKNPRVHVRQRADRYKVIGRPKSEAGDRVVPLTPTAAQELRVWKNQCFRKDGHKVELVFPNQVGNIDDHMNMVKRGLTPIMTAAGIVALDQRGEPKIGKKDKAVPKYTGMHVLRHFFASWCINRKADGGLELPGKVVQERLGHSSIVMTMDTYGHLFPRGDDSAELAAAEKRLLG